MAIFVHCAWIIGAGTPGLFAVMQVEGIMHAIDYLSECYNFSPPRYAAVNI